MIDAPQPVSGAFTLQLPVVIPQQGPATVPTVSALVNADGRTATLSRSWAAMAARFGFAEALRVGEDVEAWFERHGHAVVADVLHEVRVGRRDVAVIDRDVVVDGEPRPQRPLLAALAVSGSISS